MAGELSAEMQECSKLLQFLKKHRDSGPFRKPVDWEGWGLMDYPDIIKHPMDLATIERNLESGVYREPSEFAHDVRLVWNNCMTFNQDGSDYYNLAVKLSKVFEEKFKKIKPDDDASMNPPTLEEKTQFSQNIYKITSEQLGAVVQMLDDHCPAALDKTSEEEIEINIDSIDTKTFRTVETFVQSALPGGKGRKKRRTGEAPKAKKARA